VTSGYSGTPLAKKLGVKESQRTWRYQMPASVTEELQASGIKPALLKTPASGLDMAHIFVTAKSDLAAKLLQLRPLLEPAGVIWVSWPKKAAKLPTDITEHLARELAFPLGLVDIKVCAVDETWTALKLVIRKSERTPN